MESERPPEPDADRFEGYPRPIDGADEAALAPFAAKHFHAAPQPYGQSFGFNLVAGPLLLIVLITAPTAALVLVPIAIVIALILRPNQLTRSATRRNTNLHLLGGHAPASESQEPFKGAMLVPGRVILAAQTRDASGAPAVDLTVRYHLGGAFRETRHHMSCEGSSDRLNMQLVPVLLLRDASAFVLADHVGRKDIR